jgi:hypothetical protein
MISIVKADPAVSAQAEAIAAVGAATAEAAEVAEALADSATPAAAAAGAEGAPEASKGEAAAALRAMAEAAGGPSGAAAAAGAGRPAAGWDLAGALAGRRDWALRKVQHLAGAAQRSATNVVPRYHAFGQQLYMYRTGVQEQQGVSAAELDLASEYVDGIHPSGPFSFHRMMAYRTRCLQVGRLRHRARSGVGRLRVPPSRLHGRSTRQWPRRAARALGGRPAC